MMMDWNEYRKQVGAAITDMAKISPDTVPVAMNAGAALVFSARVLNAFAARTAAPAG